MESEGVIAHFIQGAEFVGSVPLISRFPHPEIANIEIKIAAARNEIGIINLIFMISTSLR